MKRGRVLEVLEAVLIIPEAIGNSLGEGEGHNMAWSFLRRTVVATSRSQVAQAS